MGRDVLMSLLESLIFSVKNEGERGEESLERDPKNDLALYDKQLNDKSPTNHFSYVT